MKRVVAITIKDGLKLKEVYVNDGKCDITLFSTELHREPKSFNSIKEMTIMINKLLKNNNYYVYSYDEFGGKCYNIMMIDISDFQAKRYIIV